MCSLLNQFISQLAKKFPTTKFIKSISTVCIPDYPDKNVPTIFIYFEGELKKQYIGADSLRGMKLTMDGMDKTVQFPHFWVSTVLVSSFFSNYELYCSGIFVEFEYVLGKVGAVKSTIEKDPRPKTRDVLMSSLGGRNNEDSESD